MATIGASRPMYAIYRNSGNNVAYHSGGVMGALVQFDIAIEGDNNNNDFYADNHVKETQRNKFSSGSLTVQTDDLRQEVSKAILGLKEQALGTIPGVTDTGVTELVYDDDQETPYLGIGMIQKKQIDNVERWRAVILRKVMFSVPSDAATTQGETIEWQTPELTASIMRDDSAKHRWKQEATFTTEEQAAAYIRYALNVPLSADAALMELRIGNETLTPAFTPGTTSYTLSTGNDTDVVFAAAANENATAVIKLNGETVEYGEAVVWDDESNSLTVEVTAEDGQTTRTYTVTVTKTA